MPLSWAPKDMQACHGESEIPLNSSHCLGCVAACVVDVNDVYMLLSRLVGHTMGMSKPQAFLDLWCWCGAAVGHSLKLSPGGRPWSIPCLRISATHPVWSEARDGETGLALERERGEGKGKSETESWGRAQPAAPARGCTPGERRREDPTSRSWSCKVKQQTQFLRPVPPAEQTTGLLSSAGCCAPQLPIPSPNSALSQSFEKQPGFSLSFKIYLEMQCLFLPCLKIDGCGRGYLPSLLLKSWPFGMAIKKWMSGPALCMDSSLNKTCCQPSDSLAWRRKVSWISDTWPCAQPEQPFFSKYLESNTNNS